MHLVLAGLGERDMEDSQEESEIRLRPAWSEEKSVGELTGWNKKKVVSIEDRFG